jgi:hypothetical protein
MSIPQSPTSLTDQPSPPLVARPSSAARPLHLALFALFLAVAALPVLDFKVPPLSDYVNHLARCYVIALDGHDTALAQFYSIKWQLIPNLAMDLIVPPLARVVDIYSAGRIFLVLTMLLLLAGPQVIHRALFRRWSVGPLAATLFLYNGAALAGTVNYLFGMGVALLGIAAWIALRRTSTRLRCLVSAAFIILLYVSHFGALGLYGVALLGLEMWYARSDASYRRRWPSDLIAFAVPFLAVPLLAVLGPGGHDLMTGPISWSFYDKLRGLSFVIESQPLSRVPDAVAGLVLLALGGWAYRRGIVRLHPAGFYIAALGVLAFLATPVSIMSAWGADLRQPLGYLFILIGFLDWQLALPRARHVFLLVLAGLVLARILFIEYAWSTLEPTNVEMTKSFARITRGSTVLVAESDNAYGHWMHYIPCRVMIERSSLCSLAFSDPQQQVLVVNPPFRAMAGGFNDDPPKLRELLNPPRESPESPSGRIYWADWRNTYDYLYLLSTTPGAANPLPGKLNLAYEGAHFQLYRIRRRAGDDR